MQLGPFAVAQLRMTGEISDLLNPDPDQPRVVSKKPLRMYVTDTLGDPYVEMEDISALTKGISDSRRQANEIKKKDKITVVIGNPPYKEKAKGKGNWIEFGGGGKGAPLDAWQPPKDWKVGAHAKHLRNLYIYFWRWATWKVFDHPAESTGIVCFITVAGFLRGEGFQKMRDYLRRSACDVWVINCTPEGHQPKVNTRIFQDVQQPVCIVMVSRDQPANGNTPAAVHYRALPAGSRTKKFDALASIYLDDDGWIDCPTDWRAPFLPAAAGPWGTFPKLEDLFYDNGSGVMSGRTWILSPDSEYLERRWDKLIKSPLDKKEALFHPHLSKKKGLGDRHSKKVLKKGLGRYAFRSVSVAEDKGDCIPPIRYGFRSFDRQWIIPDNRLINRPNPEMWEAYSPRQIYITAPSDLPPTKGPALSLTSLLPDMHHYNGRGGRQFSLFFDTDGTSNISTALLALLSKSLKRTVSPEDVFAYLAAVAAHPAYTARFKADLVQPGLRIPLTADAKLFDEAVALGREVVWLHTFGERFVDAKVERPASPPRLPAGQAPKVPAGGAIPGDADAMPNDIDYDADKKTLKIGDKGRIVNVPQAVWAYEVSGKQVLTQWFSYRKKNRSKPPMGDKRPPSKLGDIQPPGWIAEYTTELLNVLNVLGRLVALEPKQADLLDRICHGKRIDAVAVTAATAGETKPVRKKPEPPSLFSPLPG